MATIQALIAVVVHPSPTDSQGNIIRDCIAEIIKQPESAPAAKAEEDSPFLPEFIVEPTQYRGPTGLMQS